MIIDCFSGEDMREERSPSYFNPHELSLVSEYLEELLGNPELNMGMSTIALLLPR